jgi:GTP cyclohydrolase I
MTTFPNDAEYSQMVTVGPVQFGSMCSHHLVPFVGEAWVSYIPNGRIVGLSKLARLVEKHSRRLQVQERMTNDIGKDLLEIDPQGVGVKVTARHLCMELRGVRKPGAQTTTTFLHGAYKNQDTRDEFLRSTHA